MEKVKRFLKVQTEPCEHKVRVGQQVQLHPQVGRRRRKSRARRDGWVFNSCHRRWQQQSQENSQFLLMNHVSFLPSDDILEPADIPLEAMAALLVLDRSSIPKRLRKVNQKHCGRKLSPSLDCLTFPSTGICTWINASKLRDDQPPSIVIINAHDF